MCHITVKVLKKIYCMSVKRNFITQGKLLVAPFSPIGDILL